MTEKNIFFKEIFNKFTRKISCNMKFFNNEWSVKFVWLSMVLDSTQLAFWRTKRTYISESETASNAHTKWN